ncbi:MAG: hypothetical protein JXA77_03080 [Bacteroidales bacterium]|nr:hypothetical protein [Bacteroidales bacterium]MBN2817509.1 hypothetical protein [Bacteroidales bacterium]
MKDATLQKFKPEDAERIVFLESSKKIAQNLSNGFACPFILDYAFWFFNHSLNQDPFTCFAVEFNS